MSKTKAGFVAIVGRPNAGKSTLLNHVVGTQLSIVTRKAQTTRERLFGILTEDTRQIVFVDTPGIHRAREGSINDFMMSEAESALEDNTVIWYMVDPTSTISQEKVVVDLLRKHRKQPVFLIFNKLDWKVSEQHQEDVMALCLENGVEPAQTFFISAKTGAGVTELMQETWKLIPESEFFFSDPEQVSDRPTRYFIAEKIREQLLKHLGEELPYSCAIQIEKFDEKSKPMRIEAVIYVERDSQKGMVIGKGGTKIKDIGSDARKTSEAFLGAPIFLGLRVKVLENWTKDPSRLRRMGYELPKRHAKSAPRATAAANKAKKVGAFKSAASSEGGGRTARSSSRGDLR